MSLSEQPHAHRFDESLTADGRYRLLVDAVTDYAIYMLNVDGIVSSWNPGARRFKGYEESEIVGQHFSRFYTPEDRATGLPERALAAARNEGKFEGEGWGVRKDGERFWASVIIDPIRNRDGDLVGYAKITRDLTERKAAESALRSSHEQFKLLVQGVTDYSIYLLSTDGLVASWNAGAQRIKGYKSEEIIGQHFSRFYTDEDLKNGEPERVLATATHERRCEKEGWRVRKNVERFWARVVIAAGDFKLEHTGEVAPTDSMTMGILHTFWVLLSLGRAIDGVDRPAPQGTGTRDSCFNLRHRLSSLQPDPLGRSGRSRSGGRVDRRLSA
jgi:PAS domain S-box-containing protein